MRGGNRRFDFARAFGFISLVLIALANSAGTGRAQSSGDSQKTNWTSVAILGGVLAGLALLSVAVNNYNVAKEEARRDRAAEEAARVDFYGRPLNTARRNEPSDVASTGVRPVAQFQIPASLELQDKTIVAPEPVNMHASPHANATIIGVARAGQTISVYGVVPSGQWVLAGRADQPLGYMRLTQPLAALLQN
jgi:hypothetical protein